MSIVKIAQYLLKDQQGQDSFRSKAKDFRFKAKAKDLAPEAKARTRQLASRRLEAKAVASRTPSLQKT